MNNERYNQIIDEAYENYSKSLIDSITFSERYKHFRVDGLEFNSGYPNYIHFTKELFINKCKTDSEFSERWGLKIEERELSQHERVKLLQEAWKNNGIVPEHEEVSTLWVEYNNLMTKYNIPVKIITVTYKDEKIEVYE